MILQFTITVTIKLYYYDDSLRLLQNPTDLAAGIHGASVELKKEPAY